MTLKTPLTFACGAYDRTLPLMTREVTVDGVDLNYVVVDEPREIFDRMAGGEGFDLAEMSLSGIHLPLRRETKSVRRTADLSVARVPAQHDHRTATPCASRPT